MSEKPTVYEALSAVIADLPGISKGDRSPEGFNYRGIEAMTKAVQPLFAKHGIVIAPSAEITSVVPSPAMKDGWQDVYLRVAWTITGPDGSTMTAQTNGIGRDRVDRGANKAQTQAFKYLLLHLLCVADRKDDGDGQTYDHGFQSEQDMPIPGFRSSLLDSIAALTTGEKALVKEFMAEHDLPPVKRMNAAQADMVAEYLMHGLPAVPEEGVQGDG